MNDSMQSPTDALDRLDRMITTIREFATAHINADHPLECDCANPMQYAIDALADDIHDCADDSHDSADNPYPMTESEFNDFADLIAKLTLTD
jgi:hypothetical protein